MSDSVRAWAWRRTRCHKSATLALSISVGAVSVWRMFHRNAAIIPLIVLCACGGAPSEQTGGQSQDVSANLFPGDHILWRMPKLPRPGASSGGSNPSSGSGGGTTGGSTPSATSPVIGGCSVFPADNPWNTRIDDTTKYPTSPMSAAYMANMKTDRGLHADWGTWAEGYGIPWQTVAGAPGVPISFVYADQSDPGPYPFPPTARIEGNGQPDSDQHVLVLDSSTCTLYETYGSVLDPDGSWQAQSGAKFNLGSDALRPDGWTSADAAGLPILPGLVKLSEVLSGSIQHALRFTLNNSQNAYIHPATHAAGLSPTDYPPMGLRVRLRADYPVASFSAQAQVILRAMQQYGMFLADNGDDWFVTGDSDDGWAPYMDDLSSAISQVTGADFEVVDTGPVSTAGL